MQIQYRTRGNTDPRGKSNVWFCRAGEDSALFSMLCEEILSRQNCAIWFDGEADAPYAKDDLESALSEMQLMVIPVVTDLFQEESRILDVEFAYASQHHIPVLPILCESGLAYLFNEKFGNLQFLDKSMIDESAISYEEKLSAFLKDTLYGDELLASVRAAFSKRLFLSYRKKDRVHARALMRAIHASDLLCDVAIWYDEYLIPGENFNESIMGALEGSALMLLAVTPNLVTEENYVRAVEYPEAKRLGKSVLPIELVQTDRKDLQRQYPEIADPISLEEDDVAAEIAHALGREGAPKHSSETDYKWALAYLNGIDVEVNVDLALDLLYRAAAEGYPPAVEQLAFLYRMGDGVARDHERAKIWYRRLLHLREAEYTQNKNEKTIAAYASARQTLAELYHTLGDYGAAASCYSDAIDLCKEGGDTAALPALYEKAGLMAYFTHNHSYAEMLYRQALDARDGEARTKETVTALVSLSYRIGDAVRGQDDAERAQEYYDKALAYTSLLEEIDPDETLRLRAVISEKCGDLASTAEETESAREHYEQMRAYAEEYSEITRSHSAKRLLSIAHDRLGTVMQSEDLLQDALGCYLESLRLREELEEETHTFEAERDVSVIYLRIGRLFFDSGMYEDAERAYWTALHKSQELIKRTSSREAMRDFGVAVERLGELAGEQGQYEEAAKYYEDAIEIFEGIAEEDSSLEARRAPAITIDAYATLRFAMDDIEGATEQFRRAFELRRALYEAHPTPTVLHDIGISYAHLRDMALMRMDFAEYAEYSEYAEDPGEALRNEAYSSSARRSYAFMYEEDARDAFEAGEYSAAVDNFLSAMRHSPEDKRATADRLEVLAFYFTKRAEDEPSFWQSEVLRIWKALASYFPNDPEYARFVALTEEKITV